MRILGIDPGLNVTGYGVLDVAGNVPRLVEAGVVRGTDGTSITARVAEIHEGTSPRMSGRELIFRHAVDGLLLALAEAFEGGAGEGVLREEIEGASRAVPEETP